MALLDLSLVTSSLKKLLVDNINKAFYGGGNTVTVTPEPPDKVGAVTNKISLYMYHVAEEAHYKNFEGPGTGERNVARTPMALCLYYILTAHHESPSPETDPLTQQTLMGYALKTMHDYALIHDGTTVFGAPILQGAMSGNDNPIQVILRPVSAEDAVSFWGAEDQQTARLSAYYEVRVVLLEPDEPATLAAPVLSLGTYLYQLGTPHIERSSCELPFTLPASAGGATLTPEVTPARVTTEVSLDPAVNRVVLTGNNLSGPQPRELWLSSEQLAGVGGERPVNLSLLDNTTNGWALAVSDDALTLDLSGTLYYLDSGGNQQSVALLPGIYAAFLRVTMAQRFVGDALVSNTNDSNQVAFAIVPRIASVDVDVPVAGKVTVTIVDTFALNDVDVTIKLYVDGQAYTEVAGTVNDGEYEITTPTTVVFNAIFATNAAGDHPIRLMANGVESPPYWIET